MLQVCGQLDVQKGWKLVPVPPLPLLLLLQAATATRIEKTNIHATRFTCVFI